MGHTKWVCRLDLARTLLAASLKGRSRLGSSSHSELRQQHLQNMYMGMEPRQRVLAWVGCPWSQWPCGTAGPDTSTAFLSRDHRLGPIPSYSVTPEHIFTMAESFFSSGTQSPNHCPFFFLSRRTFFKSLHLKDWSHSFSRCHKLNVSIQNSYVET